MASKLENLPDKFLHKLINPLLEDYAVPIDYVRYLLESNDSERELLEDKFKPTGLLGDIFQDSDFIAALCKENWDALKSNEPLTEPLKRPKFSNYSVELRVTMTKYTSEWWNLSEESYSQKNCELLCETRLSNGELDWWEGNMIEEDVHDTDTNDISIHRIRLISESKNKKPLVEGVFKIIETKSLDDLFKMRHLIEEEIKLRLKE
jgi:hypothetical protein